MSISIAPKVWMWWGTPINHNVLRVCPGLRRFLCKVQDSTHMIVWSSMILETTRSIISLFRDLVPSHPLSRTSPWGVLETPWTQRGPRSDTWYLWCHWWEGPSHPNVGEGPGVENTSHPWRLGVMRVRPCAMNSLWHPNSIMLNNTSIGGVS